MTDAQEDKLAEWLKNYPEMYNKGKQEYRDMDRLVSFSYPYTISLSLFYVIM